VTVDVLTAPDRWPTEVSSGGDALAFDVEDLGVEKAFEADVDLMPDTVDVRRHRLSFVAADVPAHGHQVVRVGLSAAPVQGAAGGSSRAAAPWQEGDRLEMGDLRIDAAPDATVTLTCGELVLPGVGRLVDDGDRGDTYTWDPVPDDVPVVPAVRSMQTRSGAARGDLRIRADLDLPVAVTPDRSARSAQTVRVPVEILVTAWRGAPGITCTLSFDNVTQDHRLRWHLPAAGPVTTWTADGLYSVQERPLGPVIGHLPQTAGYEAAIGVAPVQTVAALGQGGQRVVVLCAGLPEVQGLDSGELAVTVLRGVGWLSRFDLTARTAGAGPQLPTPGAQCPGPQSFTLGVRWGEGVADDLDLVAAGAEHRSPVHAVQVHAVRVHGGDDAPATPTDVLAVRDAVVTAWKLAEDRDGSVLRLCNPTAAARRAEVTGSFLGAVRTVEMSEFDERRGETAAPAGTSVQVDMPPYAVRTLRLLP